ncbi:hypothetical protein LJR231_005587 [Phyllobacterium sp. LjRoot231]|uniref:hypothetical protein n=1 Tax=Phyllobacterium sp. LjRoot231 TaxID=3342289 RepID=UPI003ECC35FC
MIEKIAYQSALFTNATKAGLLDKETAVGTPATQMSVLMLDVTVATLTDTDLNSMRERFIGMGLLVVLVAGSVGALVHAIWIKASALIMK